MQDFTDQISAIAARLDEASGYLRIDELKMRQPQLEAEASRPDLWDDQEKARKVTSELSAVNEDLELYDRLQGEVDDLETLHMMAREENDESLEPEIAEQAASLEAVLDELEMRSLFTGEFDERDAVCQIKSGEGGTDAQDWAEMLMRMYNRWADKRGFDIEILAVSEGTEAGLSNVEFVLKGRHAYGLMQAEHGVHRLVRISPFNNEGKRQTAFSAVQVAPFFEEVSEEIEIDEKDLRIDTYRSSGAGGQHVNVTDSAVRITHLPTGLVTACQNERSQHQNKDRAMKMMAAKLLDLERKKREEEIAGITGEQQNVGFGSQIRSYVMQPYQMVKDLRSEHETAQVDSVLGGDIEPFMEAWLRWTRAQAADA
ncbi:MAG: peptide chain release factor 2 [Actinomycetota bacterium]|jgi:peptide chain release factor 2|nr:peptide chain release factor 2 [Acidimicrobiales bacterium]MEC7505780.1 peptide chain release factor 2 [Actinomycetota bacterium]HAI63798.1 peptide chain release factor 2 [Acidimicrobiaceae bacterium]HBH75130.1 peptide chain release factor 2 [Acidimicrobiaceae bacterium]|tara:strand:+ start:201 stop:1313 length:1113 start_codon:yes stop_codon:yes gene_type:complete